MKRIVSLALAAVLALALNARGEIVNRIAAVVNDQIISTHQLDKELTARRGPGWLSLPAAQQETLRRETLPGLIEETLVQQRIAELGLKVSDDELEAAIQDVQRQNKLTREQLMQALEAQGMSFTDYQENLRKQILRFKLVGREVQSKVEVTSQELRDYFRDHIDEYREAPYLALSRISFLIPKGADSGQIDALHAKAEQALARIRGGEDFHEVLLAFVAENSAEGGDMGTFAEGELTATFEEAVRGLAQGEVAPLVESVDGFHILKVTEKSPGKIRQFDEVKGEIEKALKERKSEEGFKTWAEGLRKNAYVDIRL
ncbi:chaperone SurA [Desulfuromonas versatilis]|uniref:Chaperone SurA n=1 Tax=Desulfuromonas versatilis TaxID=2802975 RepID=A0ABN6DRV2_9BACT|nr:SurA N-terminal domain-containing protein [Desulfuromonas versatilis]BCR02971.1 chaperone SurA [Desulfuromonas versatilis]